MFRILRDAARAFRGTAMSLLRGVGRVAMRAGRWVGRGGAVLGSYLAVGLKYTTRLITWSWMNVVEIYSLVQAPFTWVIGNVTFWLLRVGETAYNWLRRADAGYMHRMFPAFSLENAWAMNMVAFYPFFAVVGWILSVFSRYQWWLQHREDYKLRAVGLTDEPYVDSHKEDLGWGTRGVKRTSRWIPRGRTPEDYAKKYKSKGYVAVEQLDEWNPDEDVSEIQFLVDQGIPALNFEQDGFGQWWVRVPDGLEINFDPPIHPAPPEDELSSDDMDKLRVPVEESYKDITDNKERSRMYGRVQAEAFIANQPHFLDDIEAQKRVQAMIFRDTKSPENGLLFKYAVDGFQETIDEALAARTQV